MRFNLVQIRKQYAAAFDRLTLLVESGADEWTARVVDAMSNTLYTAHRMNARSAQTAALEFALATVPACQPPAPVKWSERW